MFFSFQNREKCDRMCKGSSGPEWSRKSLNKCDVFQKKVLKSIWSRSELKAIHNGAGAGAGVLPEEPPGYSRKRLGADG